MRHLHKILLLAILTGMTSSVYAQHVCPACGAEINEKTFANQPPVMENGRGQKFDRSEGPQARRSQRGQMGPRQDFGPELRRGQRQGNGPEMERGQGFHQRQNRQLDRGQRGQMGPRQDFGPELRRGQRQGNGPEMERGQGFRQRQARRMERDMDEGCQGYEGGKCPFERQ